MKPVWKHLKKLIFSLTSLCLVGYTPASEARKLNLKAGLFNVEAKTSGESGSLSGLGYYQVSMQQAIHSQWEASIGYSLIMSRTIGGDLGFGLDIGLNYFPITRLKSQMSSTKNLSIVIEEIWRPFLSLGFLERRFQSVEANYAGFSVGVGAERQIDGSKSSLIFDFKYSSLSGSGDSEASELNLSCGISVPF